MRTTKLGGEELFPREHDSNSIAESYKSCTSELTCKYVQGTTQSYKSYHEWDESKCMLFSVELPRTRLVHRFPSGHNGQMQKVLRILEMVSRMTMMSEGFAPLPLA